MINRVNMAAERRNWLGLAFAVVLFALALDVLIRHDPIGVDFHTYLAAARTGIDRGWSLAYNQDIVALEQWAVAPGMKMQPFLSPPTVALVTAPLARVPYQTAYVVWAVFCFAAFALALAWAGVSRGISRWIAVVGALAPWWVMHAVNVGQVVPLVAAGTVVAWRLLRDRRDMLAGIALLTIFLKPNTAVLVPFAVLFAGRYRAFGTWVGASTALALVVFLLFGTSGVSAYVAQLRGPLPSGADDLTLHGALGATGALAMALRLVIVGAVLVASFKLRQRPGLVLAIAIVGSLVISPYLHGSDLCMLAAAGFVVWESLPVVSWRALLVGGWVLASPFVYLKGYALHLNRWPWFELLLLLALVIAAWRPLTSRADSGRQAPA